MVVTPSATSATAGDSITYDATAYDSSGGNLDVTSYVNWSITSIAQGSWSESTYSTAKAGNWIVNASLGSSLFATSQLNVTHGSAETIAITPQNQTITAGQSQTYNAVALDNYNNSWDVTSQANFGINNQAGGSWNSNIYNSAKAGIWTITASLGDFADLATLTVNHGSPVTMNLTPANANLTAGSSVSYNVSATDYYGNAWDATNSTVFNISSGAQGSWLGNLFTSAKAGTWQVTALLGGISDQASLTVSHSDIYSLAVSPNATNLNAGVSQSFSATALDFYQNSWDVTNSTVFSIDAAAGGSWSGNTYTSENLGNWTVNAQYSSVQGTGLLAVYYPIDFNFDSKVNFHDLELFIYAYINFNQNGVFNPAYDLNHNGKINFHDLEIFVQDYEAFSAQS